MADDFDSTSGGMESTETDSGIEVSTESAVEISEESEVTIAGEGESAIDVTNGGETGIEIGNSKEHSVDIKDGSGEVVINGSKGNPNHLAQTNTLEAGSESTAVSKTESLEETKPTETETFELKEHDRQELKEKLGWSDKKIDAHCRVDKDGVIHYKTDCQSLEGKTAECGVPYERNTFTYKDVKMEGVFPVFESRCDVQLKEESYQKSNGAQFREATAELNKAIENDPQLKSQFTPKQLEAIARGDTPPGYTWHHHEEPGRMQLVPTELHDRRVGGAAHTGGNSIWGNKSVESSHKNNKGVSF